MKLYTAKRDAYYKYKNRTDKRFIRKQQIINTVRKRRISLPKEGIRKLIKSLDDDLPRSILKTTKFSVSILSQKEVLNFNGSNGKVGENVIFE
ncbi:hypothetical protein [Formosa sp. PL04]|uniref:hypothetical protein n=1 Tax=Formosa sp. PL04 TaxID=3081755 RepID=UPI002982B71A|nr:hypothetical protein [Formosa sp. PL04]MDW5287540.1 hypothetical protein [Formosa sp. PL04]